MLQNSILCNPSSIHTNTHTHKHTPLLNPLKCNPVPVSSYIHQPAIHAKKSFLYDFNFLNCSRGSLRLLSSFRFVLFVFVSFIVFCKYKLISLIIQDTQHTHTNFLSELICTLPNTCGLTFEQSS